MEFNNIDLYELISKNKNLIFINSSVYYGFFGFVFNSKYYFNNEIFYSLNDNKSILFMSDINSYYFCAYKIHIIHWLFFYKKKLLIFYKYMDSNEIYLLYNEMSYNYKQFNQFNINYFINKIESQLLLERI